MRMGLELIGKEGWDGFCWEVQSRDTKGRETRGGTGHDEAED